jgi:hypothetical protein
VTNKDPFKTFNAFNGMYADRLGAFYGSNEDAVWANVSDTGAGE